MRCDNCGWDNPDNSTHCIKCNTALQSISQENKPVSSTPQRSGGGAFAGTINDGSGAGGPGGGGAVSGGGPSRGGSGNSSAPAVFAGTIPDSAATDQANDVLVACPNPECGYLNSGYLKTCVRCKTPLGAGVVPERGGNTVADRGYSRKPGAGTIDPYRVRLDTPPSCRLKLVPRDGEALDAAATEKEFVAGETPIALNRTNLDPANNSITSKVQAELVFDNGKWLLSDRSDLCTTLIRVGERTELKEGDIIIMGDRKFIFTAPGKRDAGPGGTDTAPTGMAPDGTGTANGKTNKD